MKKLAILAALTLLSVSAMADKATVALNNFDANGGNGVPIYLTTAGTLAPTASTFVQILGGAVGSATSPLVDKTGAVIPPIPMGTGGAGAGFFDAGVGIIPGLADSAQATLTLQAWQGTAAGGFAGATSKASVTWNQATGSWNSQASPPALLTGPTLAIPGTSLLMTAAVPEPSTIALGLLGGLALLIRRRK